LVFELLSSKWQSYRSCRSGATNPHKGCMHSDAFGWMGGGYS